MAARNAHALGAGHGLRTRPPAVFTELEFAGLPEPVCRYFAAAIAPGAPLHASARFEFRGHLRHRWWVPFRARYELTPRLDFAGLGTAAEIVVGAERYVWGTAARHARLAGIVPVRSLGGGHLSRSTAGRAALAAVLLPTALLPRFGTTWTATDGECIRALLRVHGMPTELELHIDDAGRPVAAVVERWGDPGRTGLWGWHLFGAVFTAEMSYGGLTVPSAGRVGWHLGTASEQSHEVLRYEISSAHQVGARTPTIARRTRVTAGTASAVANHAAAPASAGHLAASAVADRWGGVTFDPDATGEFFIVP